MARPPNSLLQKNEGLPERLVAVEQLLSDWARAVSTASPLSEAAARFREASEALRQALQQGVRRADPDAAALASIPLPTPASDEPEPKVLMALSTPSKALEAVFRVRGLSVVRCEPSQVDERARALVPALVVLDPFSDPGGWAGLYAWRREARLAHTEVLLARPTRGREDAPFADAGFLARPLGRADLDTRVRALLTGRGPIARAVVASEDDSCQRLATVLSAHGVAVQRAGTPDELLAAVAIGVDLVFVPLLFGGLPTERLVEQVRPGGEGPSLVFLIGPVDADDERVTGLGQRLSSVTGRPLALALDDVVTRVLRLRDASGPSANRGVLSMRVFLAVFERVADYATRHGRGMLVLRVVFAEDPAASLPDDLGQHLATELAFRLRLHDSVARNASGALALLTDATPEHLPRLQRAVFEPAHRALADRCGRPLPPFVITAIACPEEARDVASLLARLS